MITPRSHLQAYKSIFVDFIDLSGYFRMDTGDLTAKENYETYCDISAALNALNVHIEDPVIEHDCISGNVDFIVKPRVRLINGHWIVTNVSEVTPHSYLLFTACVHAGADTPAYMDYQRRMRHD